MTSPDKPENDENGLETGENAAADENTAEDSTVGEPETVDAEIVDESEPEPEETRAAPEESTETADAPAKRSGGLSVGLILLVILVLTLGFALISRFGAPRHDEPPVVAMEDAPPAVTAEVEGAPDEETIAEAAEEVDEPVVEQTPEPAKPAAPAPAEKTANEADSVKSAAAAATPPAEEELSLEELAAQRREAAAERARQRREQSQDDAEASAPEQPAPATEPAAPVVAENETDATDEPVAEEPADSADTSVASESVAGEGNAALLAEQRETNARQAAEIAELRQELDSAIAEQDRKSEQRIAQLEERIAKIQSQDIAAATKQAAMALAVSNLQRQMYSGRPFSDQLAVLEKLTGPNASVRDLKDYAEEGLPPLTYLQYQFLEASRQSLAAARREEAAGPIGEFWANFVGLFTVRKKGAQSGDNPSAIISRAEVSLEDGDIEAALRELSMLEGEPAKAFEPWMEEARARLAADQLLDDVTNRVLAQAG